MEETGKALGYALRALARRDHSAAELERKLRGKVSPEATARVMARLLQSGYLDDRRFAERWAEGAVRNGRGYGVRLRLELARRGVERELIEEVVAGITLQHGEEETLRTLAAKKFADFDPHTAPERDKRRVMAYLQRKGFSLSAILHYFRTASCTAGDI